MEAISISKVQSQIKKLCEDSSIRSDKWWWFKDVKDTDLW